MKKLYSLLVFLLPFIANGQTGIITTISEIPLGPRGIVLDALGNIYVTAESMIWKISPTGITSIIAGDGVYGFGGDDGPAISAHLRQPTGIVIDNAGNIIFCDAGNNRIRKINTAGIISTIAGTGVPGSSGDGGAATAAEMSYPFGIVIDGSGNIYFSDSENNRVRKISSLNIITTVAGTGSSSGMWRPFGITLDPTGNLYIGDWSYIYKINTSGSFSVISSNGGCEFPDPFGYPNLVFGLSSDIYGNVYISDNNNTIRKLTPSGTMIRVAGNAHNDSTGDGGPATAATLGHPYSVVPDSAGNLYIADTYNSKIRKVTFFPDEVSDSFSVYIDHSCDATIFTARTNFYTTSSSIKTYFGDGDMNTTSVSYGCSGGGVALIDHTYSTSGTYTIKQVLYNGSLAVDSITYTHHQLVCLDFAVNFYIDSNSNCAYDTSEHLNTIVPVTIAIDSNGVPVDTISAITGFYYRAHGVPGDIYAFKVLPLSTGMNVTCPAIGIVYDTLTSYSSYSKTCNIGLSCSGTAGFDFKLYASTVSGVHAAGIGVTVYNTQCTPQDGTLTLHVDPKYPVLESVSPTPLSVAGNIVTWEISDLSVSMSANFYVRFIRPDDSANLMPGDSVNYLVTVAPTTGDLDTTNNIIMRTDTVRTSWDPNDISVTPAGNILNGTKLQYTIQFENTGNDTAHNIHVLDTLSDDVDPHSLRVLMASAGMNIAIYRDGGHNVVKFDFPGINLLDSSHHGLCDEMVVFTINAKTGLPNGRQIANEGGIYFDDNAVVMTNTVINTILVPSINITPGAASTCSGNAATFTAVSQSLQTPHYKWKVNGLVQGTDNASFSTTSLNNGDIVSCLLYNATNDTVIATSNNVTTTINTPPVAGTITGASSVCQAAAIMLSHTTTSGTWAASNGNVTLSGATITGVYAGTAIISYTMINTCGTAIATKTITVSPLPATGTITGPSSVCVGGTIILTASASGGFWHPSNPNATISSSGAVTGVSPGGVVMSYSLINACGNASATTAIIVNPLPDAGTLSGVETLCPAGTTSLASTTTGGIWTATNSNATITTAGLVHATFTGIDTFYYTTTNTCGTATATKIMTLDPLPSAGSIDGAATVCETATTTLTAAGSGVWNASNSNATVAAGIVTGITPGTVEISYSITNTCGTATANHILTVNPMPVAGSITGAAIVCESATITAADPAPGGVWSASNSHATVTGGIVTGATAGAVTISYTVTNSCGAASATSEITVNPLPVPGSIDGPGSVCVGSSITLADAATGGSWSLSNLHATLSGGLLIAVSEGIIDISYTVSNSCGTLSATKTITVNPLPNAGTIEGVNKVCVGDNITLLNAVVGGIWSTDNGNATVTGGVVTGVVPGSVTISYSVTNTCGIDATSAVIIVDICTLGVMDKNAESEPQVFPNPVREQLSILSEAGVYHSLVIVNGVGAVMMQLDIDAGGHTLVNIQQLTPGMYYIKLLGTTGTVVKQFVKL